MARTETPKKSYSQYCAVARGLDVVGERWTLLIVRDLLLGPKRYKDLLEGLPGIGTNLLADRLRELEALGILKRDVLPPPAGSTVYQLTEVGRELEPVVMALGRWGHRFLGAPRTNDRLLPGPYFVSLRATFRPEAAANIAETYEFHVDGRVFEVRVDHGRCFTREGSAHAPDVVMRTDIYTLGALLAHKLSPKAALAAKKVLIDGPPGALAQFVTLFSWRKPDLPATRRQPTSPILSAKTRA